MLIEHYLVLRFFHKEKVCKYTEIPWDVYDNK